jgi:hypothetical protein
MTLSPLLWYDLVGFVAAPELEVKVDIGRKLSAAGPLPAKNSESDGTSLYPPSQMAAKRL